MDVFEFAKKLEKDGENLYRKMAVACPEIDVTEILMQLAEDELNHFRVFEEMQKNMEPVVARSNVLDTTKNVVEQFDGPYTQEPVETDIYKMALAIEKRSEAFYRDKARIVKTKAEKDIFLKIARQEHDHYLTVNALLKVFMKEP